MEDRPQQPPAQAIAESGLSELARVLKEAAAGMPTEPAPEAADLKAQVERLDALCRNLAYKEAELESRRELIDKSWKAFSEEVLPKLKQRLQSSGLDGLFDFHAILIELNRYLAARTEETAAPRRSVQREHAADESERLQKEVTRLLSSRRRVLRHPLRTRLKALEAEVERLKSQQEDAGNKEARLTDRVRALEAELVEEGKKAAQAASLARSTQAEKEALESMLDRVKKLAEDRFIEFKKLTAAMTEADDARSSLQEKLSEAGVQRERLEARLEQATRSAEQRAVDAERAYAQVKAREVRMAELEADVATKQEELNRHIYMIEELRKSLSSRTSELTAWSAEQKKLFADKLSAESELTRALDERNRLQAALVAAIAELSELKNSFEKAQTERNELRTLVEHSKLESVRINREAERAVHELGAREKRAKDAELAFLRLMQEKKNLEAEKQSLEDKLKDWERTAIVEKAKLDQRVDALESELESRANALSAAEEEKKKLVAENLAFPAAALEIPPVSVSGTEEASRAFEAVFPRLSALALQLRRLAGTPLAAVPPNAVAFLAGRLAQVRDELRAAFELIAPSPEPVPVALGPLLDAAVRQWEVVLKRRGVTVVRRIDPKAPKAGAHEERLKSALYQLLSNAHDMMPKGGVLTVAVESDAPNGEVNIVVSDNGKGFAPAVLKDPFTPYAHSRPGHLGIGLALVSRVVGGFGGRAEAQNQARGARVVIHLPVAEETKPVK
jgi:signal transduction histidine kinase